MTPPGPHPMSAGGEAVAYIAPFDLESLNACRGDEHNGFVHAWMRPDEIHTTPLYATPPAIIPAEAIKKLIEQKLAQANSADRKVGSPYAQGAASAIRVFADELTTLIKERSNG